MGHAGHNDEASDGRRWFIGALLVAIAFVYMLNSVDDKLTFSDKEVRLGATLRELRTAQASLGIRGTDGRLSAAHPAQPVVDEMAATEENHTEDSPAAHE